MATERYHSNAFVPHSSTLFCLPCVTLPSFSSFSLYVVPSFCRFLSTFVFAHFRRYCRCSSRVDAVFSVPRPFCSAFRASHCYLSAPFAFFSVAFCFIVQRSQKACPMFNSSTNGKDITKTCPGKIKAGGLMVKAWDNPPLHLDCSKRLWTATIDSILDTKKNKRSSEPPTSKSRPSLPRSSRTPSKTFEVRRILLSL